MITNTSLISEQGLGNYWYDTEGKAFKREFALQYDGLFVSTQAFSYVLASVNL